MNLEDYPIPASTRFADLLEQIDLINPMIELHADDPLMRDQYQRRKEAFVREMSAILREYKLLDGELSAA